MLSVQSPRASNVPDAFFSSNPGRTWPPKLFRVHIILRLISLAKSETAFCINVKKALNVVAVVVAGAGADYKFNNAEAMKFLKKQIQNMRKGEELRWYDEMQAQTFTFSGHDTIMHDRGK